MFAREGKKFSTKGKRKKGKQSKTAEKTEDRTPAAAAAAAAGVQPLASSSLKARQDAAVAALLAECGGSAVKAVRLLVRE